MVRMILRNFSINMRVYIKYKAFTTHSSVFVIMHSLVGDRSAYALCGATMETALRLGRFFGMSPEFWMNAQAHYDLLLAEAKLSRSIAREVTPYEGDCVRG